MRLIEPSVDFKDTFLAMAEDYKNAGESRYQDETKLDFNEYVNKLINESKEIGLKPNYVPGSTFWLVDDSNAIVGVIRLRHRLTPELEKECGHIGYDVPPSHRKKGYGSLMLKLVLEKAKELELEKVLVTCDKDNIGSAKIIQKNGGVFENEIISDRSGKVGQRYWIQL